MESAVSDQPQSKVSQFFRSLGPGILMASAAVGGSHLVASTKAGAIYGWQLAALILLVNLFKYPFFRAGVQYTMGTGKTLVEAMPNLVAHTCGCSYSSVPFLRSSTQQHC